jgi:hypothetical protein
MASAFKPCWTSTGMPTIRSLVSLERIASALIMPLFLFFRTDAVKAAEPPLRLADGSASKALTNLLLF